MSLCVLANYRDNISARCLVEVNYHFVIGAIRAYSFYHHLISWNCLRKASWNETPLGSCTKQFRALSATAAAMASFVCHIEVWDLPCFLVNQV